MTDGILLVPRVDREHQVAVGQLSWWIFDDGELVFVLFECPNGHVGTLRHVHSGSGHFINERGSVQPSVVCPHAGCDFHRFIRLDGWLPRI